MAGKNQAYAERYAEFAMEQMRLYGIPASVTLAQGILESASGQSRLAQNENNHFGIKATQSWIANGGRYGLYTDDKPNEKFCSYDSVGDSYAHHSRFLKENSRYASCFKLDADDYRGWAQGLDKAGYATAGKYAPALISIIESNNLQRYDRMVMEEMNAKGLKPGQGTPQIQPTNVNGTEQDYSFPLKREEFLFVTSPFGMRTDPTDPSKKQMHKGMDIRCDNEAVLATEKDGKVVAVNDKANTPGGKSVTVEYAREGGAKVQVSYLHLSSISVKVGDTVNAGQQIGVSGNTGTRTTGAHLHLGVKQIASDGTGRDMDPAAYLAEIAEKGNIRLTAMHDGQNLLAKYKSSNPDSPVIDMSLSPEEWMKKLLSSEDSGIGMGGYGQDPVMEMAMTLFTSLMALAVQIDNRTEEEQMAAATVAATDRRIDLTPLVKGMRECTLMVKEGENPILSVDTGTNRFSAQLTAADMNRLNFVLSDSTLTGEEKKERISGIVGNIALNAQLSQDYRQGMSQQSQSENISIR
ncbi:glucosaminidase domain-containing protein [Phocaeicola vulgatus]|uniref:glucosaminidase domain-containing protein n=1 Tax=Phocaeicola vulgatus TaxID=821 RepID=UPI001E3E733F|nr:glucosaminidase domain-containing protein [Phocaeicola vulgatus]